MAKRIRPWDRIVEFDDEDDKDLVDNDRVNGG